MGLSLGEKNMVAVAPPTEEGLKRRGFTLTQPPLVESLRAADVRELAPLLQAKG